MPEPRNIKAPSLRRSKLVQRKRRATKKEDSSSDEKQDRASKRRWNATGLLDGRAVKGLGVLAY